MLPQDDQEPTISSFLNAADLNEGQNRIRILTDPINGNRYWHDGKPVSKRKNDLINMAEVDVDRYGNKRVDYFWAIALWNYDLGCIQTMVITQRSIREGLRALEEINGDFKEYDVILMKKEGAKPPYSVFKGKDEPLSDEIKAALAEVEPIPMDVLYDGLYPLKEAKNNKLEQDSSLVTEQDMEDLEKGVE